LLPVTSSFRQAQAAELLANPAATDLPLVLVGDFNSPGDGTGVTYNALMAARFKTPGRWREAAATDERVAKPMICSMPFRRSIGESIWCCSAARSRRSRPRWLVIGRSA